MASAKGKQPAAAKNKTAAKKAPQRKAAAPAAKRRRKKPVTPMPALGLLISVFSVLLLFCLLSKSNALLIITMRGVLNGTFGVLAVVALVLLIALGLQIALGDRWPLRRIALFQAACIVLLLATLLQVFQMDNLLRTLRAEGYVQNYNGFLWKSYQASQNVPIGGGSMGALLAYPMGKSLDVLGSALVLFFAIFALGFWMLRTVAPGVSDRMSEWFAQWREDYAERREERAAEKETEKKTRAQISRNPANAQLLVPLPENLAEEEADEAYAPVSKRVAKGRRTTPAPRPDPEQIEMDWDAPAKQAVKQPAKRPALQPEPPQQPQNQPDMKDTGTGPVPRPAKPRTARLYIERSVPVHTAPMEDAYTDYDVERFKYASRPSRKDPNAIPDFILKRREALDRAYGQEEMMEAEEIAAGETLSAAEGLPWDGEADGGKIPRGEEGEGAPEEELPTPGAFTPPQTAKPYILENPLDKQPALDPQTRLDRPDWKPPEPEPEPILEVAEPYRQPPFSLLLRDEKRIRVDTRAADAMGAKKLEETLASFGVTAYVIKVVHGPAITRYELQPAPGIKVSKITGLTDDIALNMAAIGVRIEAPIPGKAAIGIELANEEIQTVHLRDVLESDESLRNPSKLAVALGKDIAGKRIIADLARMPHLLIAGATGSGKSVCINTLIASIIYRATPEEVRMILIDPKKVELAVYNGIPHLLVPVVTDPKKASGALAWAVMEMDERYKLFAEIGVRDIKGYNAHRDADTPLMPQIVVIIDELSDLMLVAPGEVEESICRLAQLARACGIHLVIATQRPSVNVITGIIKANIPSRIAFAVSSQVDSRTILDGAGAEKLLGKGDMLYAPSGGGKPLRVQGCFVSDDEVARVVEFVKGCHTTEYSQAVIDALEYTEESNGAEDDTLLEETCDALFEQAVEMAIESGQASISMLQRRLRVGYARAGRLVDEMARRGIIGQAEGAKPREVLMTREEYHQAFKS